MNRSSSRACASIHSPTRCATGSRTDVNTTKSHWRSLRSALSADTNFSMVSSPGASVPCDTVNAPLCPASMARSSGSRIVRESLARKEPSPDDWVKSKSFGSDGTCRNWGTPYLTSTFPSERHSLLAATPVIRWRSRTVSSSSSDPECAPVWTSQVTLHRAFLYALERSAAVARDSRRRFRLFTWFTCDVRPWERWDLEVGTDGESPGRGDARSEKSSCNRYRCAPRRGRRGRGRRA